MNGALRLWWRRLRVMTAKELLQLGRDVALLAFILYAFTGDIYLAGSGVTLSLTGAVTLARDLDLSPTSRELLGRFQLPYFRLEGSPPTPRAALHRLDTDQAMLLLEIPPHFQRDLLRGRPAQVQLQVDATNSVLGYLASSYAAQIVGGYGSELAAERMAREGHDPTRLPRIESAHRVWFNPNQTDSWFMSISELLTVITLFSLLLPAVALVREKERGTVEQLLVSPLTPLQIVLPKMLAMTGVILAGTALALAAVLVPLFQVPIKGSLALFFAVTTLYVLASAGIATLLATLARNMAQVGMLVVLVLSPIILLSGTWTPPEVMPAWMRALMLLSPLHYFIDAAYGILLKGAGLPLLWDSLLGLLGLGTATVGLGLWRFRRQFG